MYWYVRFCNAVAFVVCAVVVVWAIERILFVVVVLWPFL